VKVANLVVVLAALFVAPTADAYSYRYADNSVDPGLEPRINFANSKEEQEREIRELLIQRLKQENQSSACEEIRSAEDVADSDSVAMSKFVETRKIIKSQFKRTWTLTWFVLGGLVLIGLIFEKYWLSFGAVIGFVLDKFVLPIINQLFL